MWTCFLCLDCVQKFRINTVLWCSWCYINDHFSWTILNHFNHFHWIILFVIGMISCNKFCLDSCSYPWNFIDTLFPCFLLLGHGLLHVVFMVSQSNAWYYCISPCIKHTLCVLVCSWTLSKHTLSQLQCHIQHFFNEKWEWCEVF